ncbi:MAG TPA: hypothetical protein DD434_12035 [Bacteroidales bacterium]|nr:hypothetical protein [Bacteroidales bacterium]
MKDNSHIIKYLNEYVKMPEPRYAVMLKGDWGCGKTYFIKTQIESWSKKSKTKSDDITLKPIYVSLYGLSNTTEVTDKIRNVLNPFLTSKGIKIAKKIIFGTIATTFKIDLNSDKDNERSLSFDLDSLNLLDIKSDKIKGEKILIFDDLERCKIPLDILFGYINNFIEHKQCKVILISNEQKIEEKEIEKGNEDKDINSNKITYKDFKEKLIGQTFEISPDYEKVIKCFLSEIKNSSLQNNFNIINDVFITSKINNLRILRQCFYDFQRLEELINKDIKKKTNYNDFIKELICYFIIFYCEYKSGNHNIRTFQELKISNSGNSILDKNEIHKDENKYSYIINKYNLNDSHNILRGKIIIYFIENGTLDIETLNQYLLQNVYFAYSDQSPQKLLKNYNLLSNIQFDEIYKEVLSIFENKKYDNIYQLLDVCGIFLSLKEDKIISYNKNDIVKIAKDNIDLMISKNNEFDNRNLFDIYYLCSDTPEFIEISSYYEKKIKEKTIKNWKQFLKDYFENLDDDKCNNIFDKMRGESPFERLKYEFTPIFYPIDVKKFAIRINELSNKSKNQLNNYLKIRYSLSNNYQISSYHIGDLDALNKLMIILDKKIKLSKSIDKYVLNNLIKTINKAIEKIKPNPNQPADNSNVFWE